MNFDEFCKGSFTKWDGEPPEGVKTWDRERGRFVDPFTMNKERPNVSYSDTYTSGIAKNANVLKKAGTAAVEQVTSEARKFTERMEEFMNFMDDADSRIRGNTSSGYTYEPKICGRRADVTSHTYDILKELLKSTTLPDTRDTYKMANIINEGETTMPTNYNEFFTTGRLYVRNVYLPNIKDVIFNPPATIVLWDDKTKTVVKAYNEDYDPEKGLAMCILKKVYGNKGRYFNNIKKWTDKYQAKKEAEEEAEIPNEVISDPAKKINLIRGNYFYARFLNFDTREEASDILNKMKEVRDTYGYVSVAYLADLVGVNGAFLDSKLGWSSLRGSQINRMRDGGYKLRLPEFNWVAEGYEIKE